MSKQDAELDPKDVLGVATKPQDGQFFGLEPSHTHRELVPFSPPELAVEQARLATEIRWRETAESEDFRAQFVLAAPANLILITVVSALLIPLPHLFNELRPEVASGAVFIATVRVLTVYIAVCLLVVLLGAVRQLWGKCSIRANQKTLTLSRSSAISPRPTVISVELDSLVGTAVQLSDQGMSALVLIHRDGELIATPFTSKSPQALAFVVARMNRFLEARRIPKNYRG